MKDLRSTGTEFWRAYTKKAAALGYHWGEPRNAGPGPELKAAFHAFAEARRAAKKERNRQKHLEAVARKQLNRQKHLEALQKKK